AVALAAALEAEVCEICSDVDGVYTADPRIVPDTRRLSELTHEEMQELAQAGAKVLNAQAVEFARDRGITIHARSTFQSGPGTQVAKTARRELRISGVAIETDLLVVRASGGAMFGELMRLLHANGAWPREVWSDNAATFALVPLENVHGPEALLKALKEFTGPSIDVRRGLGQVSIVGSGLGASLEPFARAQEALKDFKVFATLTGPLRLSFLLPKESGKDAVRKLHDAFVEPAQA
ncbi:MAG: aspartate kinase, partial [Deltaproteobacteria bacterium]|nr:aspartate kinase [Deltaproteobacteria bacterium]